MSTTVDPLTDAALTVTASLPMKTVYLSVPAVVERKVSLNVNVTVVPEAETVLRVGAVTSGPAVEKLETAAPTSDTESLPDAS